MVLMELSNGTVTICHTVTHSVNDYARWSKDRVTLTLNLSEYVKHVYIMEITKTIHLEVVSNKYKIIKKNKKMKK
jgi:hypothetical protein